MHLRIKRGDFNLLNHGMCIFTVHFVMKADFDRYVPLKREKMRGVRVNIEYIGEYNY